MPWSSLVRVKERLATEMNMCPGKLRWRNCLFVTPLLINVVSRLFHRGSGLVVMAVMMDVNGSKGRGGDGC